MFKNLFLLQRLHVFLLKTHEQREVCLCSYFWASFEMLLQIFLIPSNVYGPTWTIVFLLVQTCPNPGTGGYWYRQLVAVNACHVLNEPRPWHGHFFINKLVLHCPKQWNETQKSLKVQTQSGKRLASPAAAARRLPDWEGKGEGEGLG